MDVSLFERMVNNNIHCVTLDTQYRMRPEIANLIRPTIYKTLIDDDSVKQFGNITGMFKNLYFINHIEQESGVSLVFIYYDLKAQISMSMKLLVYIPNRKMMKLPRGMYSNHNIWLLYATI